MSDYIISCCSTVDVPREQLESRNISYICFHFTLDGKDYTDDFGHSIPFDEFYKKMVEGAETRTSQINILEYSKYFEELVKQGKDVLHISLSSGLSGSFNSATNAARMVEEKYPDRRVVVVDSLGASSGYGLIVDKAADLRDSGMSMDEVHNWLEENKLRMHHWFYSTDLTFYIKGGRISKASGTIGTILGICPLLDMNTEGKLIPRAKIRSKKKVIQEIVNRMKEHAQNGLEYADKCYICHSACEDDAEAIKQLVKESFKNINGDIEINYIGTTIGSHSGPGTAALFFWGDERIK